MNPFEAAEAVAHPERYNKPIMDEEGNRVEDTSLSAGGVDPNSVNNFAQLAELLNTNSMSAGSLGGSPSLGDTSNIFNNPFPGESGPVADRQVVNYNNPVSQNPFSSQPTYNPNTGTSRTLPNSSFSFGSSNNNNFSVGSGTAGMFDSAGTNISNFLRDTFGSSYNPDFGTTATAGQGSVDWGTKDRAFDFGGKLFNDGKGLQTPGWTKDALGFAKAAGYNTSGINQGLALANLSGNSLFDYAATRSGNPYVGMLNDDFSQRGIMSKALGFSKVPYASGIMGALDYSQGYNNYGALGSTIGSLFGPVGSFVGGYLGKNALGFNKEEGGEYGGYGFTNYINDNYSGAGRDYAEASGFKVGTPEFDYAIKGFESLQRQANSGKNTQGQQELVDKWNNKYLARMEEERAAAQEEYNAETRDFGAPGDELYRKDGITYRSSDHNWNTPSGSELTANGYTWDSNLGSVAEMKEETGLGTKEFDPSHPDFAWNEGDAGGYGETDTSEGTTAGDYMEGGFSKEDMDFATSFDSDDGDGTTDSSDDPGGDDDDAGGWSFDDSSSDSGGGDSGGGGGGSYIATAATQALGEEGLTIFENWRDYMFTALPTFKTSYGRYRVTAPKIVTAINKKKNAKEIYNYIWDMHLKPIFDLIREDRDSDKALKDYKKMVRELQNKFLKNKEKA